MIVSQNGKEDLIVVENLVKYFPVRGGLLQRIQAWVKAVDGVSFTIKKGETLGLVGESGCGKTTVGRTILGLIPHNAGAVHFEGQDVLATFASEKERGIQRNVWTTILTASLFLLGPLLSANIFQDPGTAISATLPLFILIALAFVFVGLWSGVIAPERGAAIKAYFLHNTPIWAVGVVLGLVWFNGAIVLLEALDPLFRAGLVLIVLLAIGAFELTVRKEGDNESQPAATSGIRPRRVIARAMGYGLAEILGYAISGILLTVSGTLLAPPVIAAVILIVVGWAVHRHYGKIIDERAKKLRREMQIVFQDPYSSLDPRVPVGDSIGEGLLVHGVGNSSERYRTVLETLDKVGMKEFHARRYPHEFSGGQRQRIGIARALALGPKFIVCDEPVSALDVSIQAQVLNILKDLQRELGFSYLFIAHNLSVVEHISDRVAVMYLGKVVELADRQELFKNPLHPYTQALMSAIPVPDPTLKRERTILKGDVPSPVNPPSGCRFHPRCPVVMDHCSQEEPEFKDIGDGHFAACWRVE
jgi:oligopeptide/dipeptide ABC transporter ATP-binding protein